MVAEEDQEKTALIVPGGGQLMFKRLAFGLCNSPATFNRVVDTIFTVIIMKYVLPYLDDFVIYSPDYYTHSVHLREVLTRIKSAGLELQPSKCTYVMIMVIFLGQQALAAGVEPDEGKLEAVASLPQPDCVKAVRSFLGLTGYYGKFVKDYATIAEPLICLTKKEVSFYWDLP
jgi:Reverse transcriptase (RNA-dependent DNA polymerase)